MGINDVMSVEVAYASVTRQGVVALNVTVGSTIQEVIMLSGVLAEFPEIDLDRQKVGIFGKRKALSDLVCDGDRVEIYRPLTIDPKEARRTKAKRMKDRRP